MHNPSRRLVISMVACLVFCLILALDLIPGLRGDFGWRWPYAVPDWPRLLPAVAITALYLVGVWRIRRTPLFLLWCLAGAAILPLACLYVLDDPFYLLVTRTLSGLATGAHMAGTEIADPLQTARRWPEIMPTYLQPGSHDMLSVHIALSPPGLPLFYYTLNRLFEGLPRLADPLGMALRPFQCQNYGIMAYSNAQMASAWFGILMPVWAGLTVFPLYRAGGRLAAAWWPLIPSLSMFTPNWNTLYPLLGLIAFLLLDRGLNKSENRIRAGLSVLLSGVLVSLLTFANISTVPLIGFLGLYAGINFLQRVLSKRTPARQVIAHAAGVLLWFVVGLISVWLVYYFVSGVTPVAILAQALGQHLELDRPYLPWIYLHLYDLALFTGFPVVLIALAAIVRRGYRPFDLRGIDPLGLALALTLIALALSGTARGETGRVWLFFVPFMLILAARWFGESEALVPDPSPSGRRVEETDFVPRLEGEGWRSLREVTGKGFARSGVSLVTVTQAITLITLVAFLRVMGTELNLPPTRPPADRGSSVDLLPAPATFAGQFTLIGERASQSSGGIDLTLSWRADRQAAVPYYLSALVVKPDGQALPSAVNWQPFETRYPITCWQPGQIVTETRHISLGDNPPTGDYWISLSAFALGKDKQITTVQVTQPGQPNSTQLGLGPIPVH